MNSEKSLLATSCIHRRDNKDILWNFFSFWFSKNNRVDHCMFAVGLYCSWCWPLRVFVFYSWSIAINLPLFLAHSYNPYLIVGKNHYLMRHEEAGCSLAKQLLSEKSPGNSKPLYEVFHYMNGNMVCHIQKRCQILENTQETVFSKTQSNQIGRDSFLLG